MIKRTVRDIARMAGATEIRIPDARPAETRVPDTRLPYSGTLDILAAGFDIEIHGVSIDTRTIQPNNLYIPIKGERFNGHDFAQAAIDGGASATLWNKDEPNPPTHIPVLIVEDTLTAIQQLAKSYRSELPVKVIGITGSNGKTSTKDILASILGTVYRTQKTKGNLNNHLGVPLTLLSLEEHTEMAVVEMGMSGLGEIEHLSSLAQLDAAIITNASEVHLGDLFTRDRIVQAKLEIIKGLKQGGLLAYCGDNPRLTDRLSKLNLDGKIAVSFGRQASNTYCLADAKMDIAGVTFRVANHESSPFFMPGLGKHQAINALAAIAIAKHIGLTDDQISQGLRNVEFTSMRNERIVAGNRTIINDAYKSNPTSLRAALDILYALQPYNQKIAVMSEMVELGDESEQLHKQIGEELDPARLDYIFTVGSMARHIANAAKGRFADHAVIVCDDQEELAARLLEVVQDDCLILIKGSRKFELERIVDLLKEEANMS